MSKPFLDLQSSKFTLKKEKTHWTAILRSQESQQDDGQFRPHQIPPDWQLAETHAQARRVALEKKDKEIAEVCPCCGYEVDRQEIDVCQDIDKLNFLGSGIPMFYNFFLYSLFIVFQFLMITGIFNLVTNLMGNQCLKNVGNSKHLKQEQRQCITSLSHQTSMANQDNQSFLYYQSVAKMLQVFILMITLLFFRKSQRTIHKLVDESQISPSDYTIIVKNIPIGIKLDYYETLKNIFENYSVPGEKTYVSKISLVYNTDEIFKIERQIEKIIQVIQKYLLSNSMNFDDSRVKNQWLQISECENKIDEEIFNIFTNSDKFAGIALISFQTEYQKNLVLRYNKETLKEKIDALLLNGKAVAIKSSDLQLDNQKLFCEQAPEPNEINWENLHIPTKKKIVGRILINCLAVLCMALFFIFVFILSYMQGIYAEKAEKLENGHDLGKTKEFAIISWVINLIIVMVNKFILGIVFHHICDHEKISTLTHFNISFAIKNALALFFNTAIMSFIIDVVMFNNVIGSQGFIYNETILFILNSFFSPLVWLIDPWSIIGLVKYRREYTKGVKSVLTQQQAHQLAERPTYSQAKRYADLIKTMWTTFLYGSVLPLGIVYSLLGMSMYYFIDKYNLVTRRTMKESVGKELALVMVSFLEQCVVLLSLGDFLFRCIMKGSANILDYLCLIISIIYAFLPKSEFNELLFPIINQEEIVPYDKAEKDFDTDYDRENPVTRKAALRSWRN